MTVREKGGDLFLEFDERQAIDNWYERLSQNAEHALSELEQEIAHAVAEQAAVDAAYADTVNAYHAAIDRLARHAERALEQLPTRVGVFVSDAERMGAYRVAVTLLSDMGSDVFGLEKGLERLVTMRQRQGIALSALLGAKQSLDAACRAATMLETREQRLSQWCRLIESVDERSARVAERIAWKSNLVSAFLHDVLPKFGRRVSKIADFGGQGVACNPHEVRRELSQLLLFLQRMKEDRKE